LNYFLVVFIFFALLLDRMNIFFYMIISSVLHEMGHIAACLVCGYKPVLRVSLFGICLNNYPEEKNRKIFVLACGPAVNFILILISACIIKNDFAVDVYVFCIVNTVILLFNILPFDFLDGGQFVKIFISDKKVIKVIDTVSVTILTLFILIFSNNTVHSFVCILLFIIYYIINKIHLRL